MGPLPLRECDVYEFLIDLGDSSAPSFGKALLSSIAVCEFVLSAEGFRMLLIAVGRLCAGFFLLCIYLCARYSDGQGLKGLLIDGPDCFVGPWAGYFQGALSGTKTSFSLER